MINWIGSWVQGIVIAVVISTIIEMILPDGNIKKYVRTVIGVYIVFVNRYKCIYRKYIHKQTKTRHNKKDRGKRI